MRLPVPIRGCLGPRGCWWQLPGSGSSVSVAFTATAAAAGWSRARRLRWGTGCRNRCSCGRCHRGRLRWPRLGPRKHPQPRGARLALCGGLCVVLQLERNNGSYLRAIRCIGHVKTSLHALQLGARDPAPQLAVPRGRQHCAHEPCRGRGHHEGRTWPRYGLLARRRITGDAGGRLRGRGARGPGSRGGCSRGGTGRRALGQGLP
mmetsp:Transcript_92989/g.289394  ORF Transcript_92989/g.289394 Transcript_92989/m.289394 type:complete len:205 (+) Transcript_92989:545-1159(+)